MSKKQHEPEHIIVQLRKVINTHGHSNVRFNTETKTDVTIAEVQPVLEMYSDVLPQYKEQLQRFVAESHDNLRIVARGDWTPEEPDGRIRARELFNNDEIFGIDSSPTKVNRRIIKKVPRA